MNYNIKGTGLDITDELRTYVEKKLAHADTFAAGDSTAHTDVELEHAPLRDGGKYRAEFTASLGSAVYRAEEWGSSLHEAIDLASSELAHEMRRSKKKHLALMRHGAAKFKNVIRGFTDRF